MNEELPRLETHYLVGRDTRVRAPDPKILRRLDVTQSLKIFGVYLQFLVRPDLVVFHYDLEVVHDDRL